MSDPINSERQKEHYEKIHSEYEKHYYDPTSMQYREEFIFSVLLKGLDLNNKMVADLASGSGHNSIYLQQQFPSATFHGFDISETACSEYRKNVNAPSYQTDLTRPLQIDLQYDFAIIIGGIHHCISSLDQTFKNINQLLKPGGKLLMCEPNSYFFLEPIRKFWYKKSQYFDTATEEALNHEKLFSTYGTSFKLNRVIHMGGPAYFLLLNSLIFHLPLSFKKILKSPFFILERFYNRMPIKSMFPYFIAEWEKM